jgi:hypothetical protein
VLVYGKGQHIVPQYVIPIPTVPYEIGEIITSHVTSTMNQPHHIYENKIRFLKNKKKDCSEKIVLLQKHITELEKQKDIALSEIIDLRKKEKEDNIQRMEVALRQQHEKDLQRVEDKILGEFHKSSDLKRKNLQEKQSKQYQYEKEQSMKRLKLLFQDASSTSSTAITSSLSAPSTTTATMQSTVPTNEMSNSMTTLETKTHDKNTTDKLEETTLEDRRQNKAVIGNNTDHTTDKNNKTIHELDVAIAEETISSSSLLSMLLNDNVQIQNAQRKIAMKQKELIVLEEAAVAVTTTTTTTTSSTTTVPPTALPSLLPSITTTTTTQQQQQQQQVSQDYDHDITNYDVLSEMKWLLKEVIKAEQLRKKT